MKCAMYVFSGLQGQGTSACPGASGAPTECTHGTNSPSSPSAVSAAPPMRVMMRMLTTTYGESVICTPICDSGDPIGPMLNGSTYMTRPRMQPVDSSCRMPFSSFGCIQLLVGPASPLRRDEMNVRCSTRAASRGSERHR